MVGPRSMGAGTPKPNTVSSASAPNATNDSTPGKPHHDTLHPSGTAAALTPAQRLIERYERMSTPPPQSPQNHQTPPALKSTYRTQYVYDYTKSEQHNYAVANASLPVNSLTTPGDTNGNWSRRHGSNRGEHSRAAPGGGGKKEHSKDKDKSPIRQSLRNLFSVLKKGAGGLAKRRPTEEPQSYLQQAQLRQDKNDAGQHPSSTVNLGNIAAATVASSSPNKLNEQPKTTASINTHTKKKMSGSLLYLTRGSQITIPETPGPLTWTTCSVKLDINKLVVSSFMGELELYVHEIDLAKCSDVHSLSFSQLNEEEKRLLGDVAQEGDNMKVFEIIFDGALKRKTEKFAAKSVKERAGWISAIWDSILPYQYFDSSAGLPPEQAQNGASPDTFKSLMEEKTALEGRVSSSALQVQAAQSQPHALSLESPVPLPIPKLSPLLEDEYLERSLPPLPANSPLAPVLPLNVPDKESESKKHPDMHIDLSEFQGLISPSIYPPTSAGPSPGEQSTRAGTMLPSPGMKKLPRLARLDTTLTTLSSKSSGSNNKVVIAPSMCPTSNTSSRAALSLLPSPTGCSTPGSARSSASSSRSITNLSQLSVVRQRLAQIERNHSQLSAGSEFSQRRSSKISRTSSPLSTSSRASTPTSVPVSPAGSGWSKGEAIFLNTRKTTTMTSRSKGSVSPGEGNASARKELGVGPVSDSRKTTSKEKERSDGHELENNPSPLTSSTPAIRSESLRSSEISTKAVVAGSKKLPNLPPASPLTSASPPIQNPVFPATSKPTLTKEDIQRLSKDLSSIKNVIGGETGYPTIHQMMVGLEHRISGDERHLIKIQDTLKVIGKRVTDAIGIAAAVAEDAKSKSSDAASQSSTKDHIEGSSLLKEDHLPVLNALKKVQDLLSHELPALSGKLQEIKDGQEKDRQAVRGSGGESPSNSTCASPGDAQTTKDIDLQPLLEKIEEIRILCAAVPLKTSMAEDKGNVKDDNGVSESITKILTLVQEEGNKQTLLSQQQADSVRYLNELNTWLESFVNNGTSQIQGMSSNIELLCRELGCRPGPSVSREGNPQPNLMNDIRQLVAGMKARDQNFTALQAAVHSLLEVLTASQTQQGTDSQAIAGLMDRQRHDQQAMFRAFTNEISGEIKGERLRFVEAMKEATAINVQIHVEQFKRELNREVMAMTEEVGRLHREKQQVENQISDLFSFYSKHKQGDMPLQALSSNVGIPVRYYPQDRPRADIPRSNNRLLPYPKPQS